MTVYKYPNVLVLHLKRFSYGNMNGKINKNIQFDLELNNWPCSGGEANKVNYQLTGVVVHHGHSTHSGHYVAYVKGINGQWLEMNDSTVTVVSPNRVLSQQAYILFYTKIASKQDDGAEVKVTKGLREVNIKDESANKISLNEDIIQNKSLKIDKISDIGEVVPHSLVSVKPVSVSSVSNSSNRIKNDDSDLEDESEDEMDIKDKLAYRNTRLPPRSSWMISPHRWKGNLLKFRLWRMKKLRRNLRNCEYVQSVVRFPLRNISTLENGNVDKINNKRKKNEDNNSNNDSDSDSDDEDYEEGDSISDQDSSNSEEEFSKNEFKDKVEIKSKKSKIPDNFVNEYSDDDYFGVNDKDINQMANFIGEYDDEEDDEDYEQDEDDSSIEDTNNIKVNNNDDDYYDEFSDDDNFGVHDDDINSMGKFMNDYDDEEVSNDEDGDNYEHNDTNYSDSNNSEVDNINELSMLDDDEIKPTNRKIPDKISKIPIPENNNNNNDILKHLLKQSSRGREISGEGQWENVSLDVVAEAKKSTKKQRKYEQELLASRQTSELDKALDQGRQKKVKKVHVEDNNDRYSNVNYFQEVQKDRDIDKKKGLTDRDIEEKRLAANPFGKTSRNSSGRGGGSGRNSNGGRDRGSHKGGRGGGRGGNRMKY
jgi:hypothetical protein